MVLLNDILDYSLLRSHISAGLVSERIHRELPLAILNYTAECQWRRQWDEVTKQTRGLIYDTRNLEVVSRPFPKFFNWDEGHVPYPPSGPALRMEKLDGSLGILYPVKMEKFNNGNGGEFVVDYGIATRGSMHSEQAEWATQFFRNAMDSVSRPTVEFQPQNDKTYLFEIVYPGNRIVVDYGDYEGLVLIDVIDNVTGFSDTDEFDNCLWPEKVKRTPVPGFGVEHVNDIPKGDEGFVYLWPARNFRTKMKSAEYVEIHRLISHLNEKTVWEALVAGKQRDDIKKGLPEEFHPWVDETIDGILDSAVRTLNKVFEKFYVLDAQGLTKSRKDFALAIKDHPLRKYLFLALDDKPVYPVALLDSKPKVSKSLVKEDG